MSGNSLYCSLRVGLSTAQPSTVVRDLGLHLDNELSMKQHVTKVATCYYHLCRLRQIRRHVVTEVTTQLVLALVISRLDYCNAALVGLPQTTIAPCTSASTKRCGTSGLRVGSKGARHSMSSPTALAACPLAHPVQTVLYYAFSF